ncbi:MAG: TolB family protein [Steroidobacteraceae bacterium]
MRSLPLIPVVVTCLLISNGACATEETPKDTTPAHPAIFAPGVISGPADDADAAFAPDGNTVFFARNSTVLVSHKSGSLWSRPQIAPFSGQWADRQPTMAPDGSFIVFVSNRPVESGAGTHPAGNLWRVNRQGRGWSEPLHLPATVNSDASIWAPSIAGDGSLYFIKKVGPIFRLWRSQYRDGNYEMAVPVSFGDSTTQDVDPAVAPDESFIVFASMHPGPDQHERLFIAFRATGGWGKPIDLGDAVNGSGANDNNEPRLGPDRQTLYFSTDHAAAIKFPRTQEQAQKDLERIQSWDNGSQNIWSVTLLPWLNAHSAGDSGGDAS